MLSQLSTTSIHTLQFRFVKSSMFLKAVWISEVVVPPWWCDKLPPLARISSLAACWETKKNNVFIYILSDTGCAAYHRIRWYNDLLEDWTMTLINLTHLHLFIHVYWITESPVVEGKIKVDTGTSVVRLSHPVKASIGFKKAVLLMFPLSAVLLWS